MVNLAGHVEMHQHLFEVIGVKGYAFPLMKIKWWMGRAFFLFLSVTILEQWGLDERNTA